MKFHIPNALVVSHKKIGDKIYSLIFNAPEIANSASPGQFVHIRCSNGLDPLLRRPISINDVDKEKGLVSIWYQVVGKGTEFLSKVKVGECLDVIGALGRGFDSNIDGKNVLLIGGGMGIAPLIYLGSVISKKNTVRGIFGGRNKDVIPCILSESNFDYELCTEDGSIGREGLVTDLLEDQLHKEKIDAIYSCGPKPMLTAMQRISSREEIPLQVSLEAVMACGVGACLGCAFKGYRDGEEAWLKVCKDGPVFWDSEVKW
ncbi:MAG: dihydroorotate dehydrogenase electron transfer subunit [Clostridia bacterium]|nr:dihydroorotate dehydrogenase electron transfer subunit [Clostridia bacterium]MDD3024628.1 dihydroorotate dehydrogenase electron transfer subunit [Syntrophomonadaceae bacterium]MDD4048511.1 dihydroorotate dehydrogenase electron transfer subunit [Clostridia bacterium]